MILRNGLKIKLIVCDTKNLSIKNNEMIIRSNYTSEYLDILIEEYIEKNVICNICGNHETILLNIKK